MTRTLLVVVSTRCAMITLGAYAAGGTDVTCTRVEASTPVLETGAVVGCEITSSTTFEWTTRT
jgi:hypothetical protein